MSGRWDRPRQEGLRLVTLCQELGAATKELVPGLQAHMRPQHQQRAAERQAQEQELT